MLGSIVPNYTEFLANRFLVGAAIAGVENTCFVMGMELVGPSKRTLAGILCWFFETSGLLLAVGLAYLFQDYDWRTLQVIYSCPGIIFFSYACLAPESIRWLASKGKYEQAELLLQKTANFNNVIISEDAISAAIKSSDDMENTAENDGTKTYTIFDLFRHRNLCAKTCVLQFTWIVCSALYYVLLLDQSELSEDHYLGFVATASVQIPGYIYVILTLDKPIFGRKRSICIFLMLSGICLIVHPFLMPRSIWKILLSVFGRFCANCSFTILHLFTAELFPTIVRSIGMGFSIVVSRIGTILAPYILLLGGEVSPVLFGLGVSLASILSLLLPETLGMPLPESISDGEKMKIVTPRNCLFGTKKNANYNPEEEA
jgi:OCT family organic cation transporter-like MFS transporter 4/5